jgi:hypothetical protein
MFELVMDIFLVVGALTPLAAYEQWREFTHSRSRSSTRTLEPESSALN